MKSAVKFKFSQMAVIVIMSMATLNLLAQKTYLTIYQTGQTEDQISYPPGTPFELRDENDTLLFSDTSKAGSFEINKPVILVVRPYYKDTMDRFELSNGSLSLHKSPKYAAKTNEIYHSNGVTAKKTLTDSFKYEGKSNVKMELSNGIIFTYIDGVAEATLNGDKLWIENQYLIYSELGVAKISFNPSNGVLYWVFEPRR